MPINPNFDPVAGLVGGSMIGLAAGALLLLTGDILGASGIVNSVLLHPVKAIKDTSQYWKLVFLSSFLLTSTIYFAPNYNFDKVPAPDGRIVSGWGYLIGGLFVGFGTKLGNGCTSGHGICGMARLSRRSFAAVATFMTTAFITTYVTSPETSWISNATAFLRRDTVMVEELTSIASVVASVMVAGSIGAPLFFHAKYNFQDMVKVGPAAMAGALFAAGLNVSTMVYPSKVFGFLYIPGFWAETAAQGWDPTLIMVMGGGMIVSFVSYQFVQGHKVLSHDKALSRPICLPEGCKFGVPTNQTIDWKLLTGATSFGIGWGVAGICPGPGIVLLATGVPLMILSWWPAYLVGAYVANIIQERC